jgi:LDH2 family malate/lactate/ureidoglycolate dehydrogenase
MTTPGVTAAVTVDAVRLHTFACNVLRAVGMPEDDATTCADAMLWAECRGLPQHGISGKLPLCVSRIRSGGTRPSVSWRPVIDLPAYVVIDAHEAWGQVAAARAMRLAIDKARTIGIGLALVRGSSTAAAMGYYVSLAIAEGMIGIAATNGAPLMPAPGGTKPVVGNQAFAIGAPGGEMPLLFDTALSVMSTGELEAYRVRGEQLPEGVALDEEGRPTRDPEKAVAGLLLPIGGHRGFGLALMIETLTGLLSGGGVFTSDLGDVAPHDQAQRGSHFLLAINVSIPQARAQFASQVDQLVERVHAAAAAERTFVPGERGAETAEARRRTGIPIAAHHARTLRALAVDVGVPAVT